MVLHDSSVWGRAERLAAGHWATWTSRMTHANRDDLLFKKRQNRKASSCSVCKMHYTFLFLIFGQSLDVVFFRCLLKIEEKYLHLIRCRMGQPVSLRVPRIDRVHFDSAGLGGGAGRVGRSRATHQCPKHWQNSAGSKPGDVTASLHGAHALQRLPVSCRGLQRVQRPRGKTRKGHSQQPSG